MAISADSLRRALTGKFGFQATGTGRGRHEKYRLDVGGVYVAHTVVSRGRHEIADPLLGAIAHQLGVSRRQVYDMVNCTMGRDAYLATVNQSR